jgi:pyruvate, orthophosphate dikinase
MPKLVYKFIRNDTDGNKDMKDLLGGKGANLCEMARLGLNVPPGMTITTDVCDVFNKNGGELPEGLMEQVKVVMSELEGYMNKQFGDSENTLLLSVRSGAKVSMPGMMDTVLNLGLNDDIVIGLAKQYGKRFAYDCYRRLLQMFGDVVLGIPHDDFEHQIERIKSNRGIKFDIDMNEDDLVDLVLAYKQIYAQYGKVLPHDPWEQLSMAVIAVFSSWNLPRAQTYRKINKITGLKGTAVNIQTMVYGNINDNSGTGVCFTRNPANGKKELYGEFLMNAQGEDVVAGIRTPIHISELLESMPTIYNELNETLTQLETHMKDMQDTEFTIQDGVLFMLQTRNGKRTGKAALHIALDLHNEGLITKQQAIMMVEPRHLDQLLHPNFEDIKKMSTSCITKGLGASPGAAVGKLVFDAETAEKEVANGEKVILCRIETSPEDVGGMHASQGILTARGGATSHAAVVARGWGKPCVCGCETLEIDYISRTLKIGMDLYLEGDVISIDGETGLVYKGAHPVKVPELNDGELGYFMQWVDEVKKLKVLTNADTPEDALVARKNGAEGIGLCRTEHMFFSSQERIMNMRKMIAAVLLDSPTKSNYLSVLQQYQKDDFVGLFQVMHEFPVVIRLLDPPLHEFMPKGKQLDTLCETLATDFNTNSITIRRLLDNLHEANPMMGLRGCRLGIVHPEITEMQCRAIFEAAKETNASPEIMVPLVGIEDELVSQTEIIHRVAREVNFTKYKVGTMIEVPRGALMANQLAEHAEFFSFGTNDLTQMTYGISRDDAESKFLEHYKKNGLLAVDPFETIDSDGVGQLIKMAKLLGRMVRYDMVMGVCGEHGGDPASVDFFHRIGLNYVSCSPLRVPIARLAAAQSAIKNCK